MLSRIIRITTTAGFLHEEELGYVRHTHLSATFCSQLTHTDAATFLSDVVMPAALRLSSTTSSYIHSTSGHENRNGFNMAREPGRLFLQDQVQAPQLRRQRSAYFRALGQMTRDSDLDFLSDHFRFKESNTRVVYVSHENSQISKENNCNKSECFLLMDMLI